MSSALHLVRNSSLALATAALCACGGGGSSGSDGTGTVSFGISDAPVTGLSSVTITVDKIIVNRPGEDIVIDRFTSAALGIEDAETFTIDLLEVQGLDSKIVADFVELPAGDYQNLRLDILDGGIAYSYADDLEGRKPIKVPSGELKLGGFNVEAGGVQVIMIEFGLRESLTYNPGPDRYILKPRGVRVVDVAAAVAIGGDVDIDAFEVDLDCMAAANELVAPALPAYAVYAYQGHGLADGALADSFDPASPGAPGDKVAPYASTLVHDDGDGSYSYLLPYLPAGNYSLAFSCNAAGDDPDVFDGLAVPLPAVQRVELAPGDGEQWACDFLNPTEAPVCAPAPPAI